MSAIESNHATIAAAAVVASPAAEETVRVHRFSVEQYYRMAAEGILSPDDRVELLDGVIVDMNPVYAPHVGSVEATRDKLTALLPKGWIVREEKPVSLGGSDPQPDLAVVRGARRDFWRRHPTGSEIGLLVEVADTTVRRDREFKAAIYAAAGVPEYWIVNLVDRQLEVYTKPVPPESDAPARYLSQQVIAADGNVVLRLAGHVVGESRRGAAPDRRGVS
jgi:Uma2 family endonuclease